MPRSIDAALNPIFSRFSSTAEIIQLMIGLFGKLNELRNITAPANTGPGLYARKEVILDAIKLATAVTKTELDDKAADVADALLTPEVCDVLAGVIRSLQDRFNDDPDVDPAEAVGDAFGQAVKAIAKSGKKPAKKAKK